MSKYTKEILQEAAYQSYSVSAVLRYLRLRQSGGNHSHISKRLRELNVDTSHFHTNRSHNLGRIPKNKKKPEEILVLRTEGNREYAHRLRRALLESGVKFLCVSCGIGDLYNGRPLTLEVDHINGDWLDNRIENLRFMCPNCHSQEETSSSGRQNKRLTLTPMNLHKPSKKLKVCLDCSTEISKTAVRCRSCSARARVVSKIEWPVKESLQKMVDEHGYLGTGRILGVSDNSVRKRLHRGT